MRHIQPLTLRARHHWLVEHLATEESKPVGTNEEGEEHVHRGSQRRCCFLIKDRRMRIDHNNLHVTKKCRRGETQQDEYFCKSDEDEEDVWQENKLWEETPLMIEPLKPNHEERVVKWRWRERGSKPPLLERDFWRWGRLASSTFHVLRHDQCWMCCSSQGWKEAVWRQMTEHVMIGEGQGCVIRGYRHSLFKDKASDLETRGWWCLDTRVLLLEQDKLLTNKVANLEKDN